MLLVLITVGSLAAALGLGIAYYKQKTNLADAVAKYEAIKRFADEAGKKIISLEEKNVGLANSLLESSKQIIALKEQNNKPKIAQETRVQAPVTEKPITQAKPNKNKFRGKRNNNNTKAN